MPEHIGKKNKTYPRPSENELRKKLDGLQYHVMCENV